MEKHNISLSISLESLLTAFQSLNLDQLLKVRECISTLIEQSQDEAVEDKLMALPDPGCSGYTKLHL